MRCAERSCAFPATAGSGYCLHHRRMFGGDWPLRDHSERNVESAPEGETEEELERREVAEALAEVCRPKPKRARRVEMPATRVWAALEAHLL